MPKKSHAQTEQTTAEILKARTERIGACAEGIRKKLGESLHQRVSLHTVPFSMHSEHMQACMLEEIHDIASGIALVLEMKERSELDRLFISDSDTPETEPAPLLSINDEAILLRFARVAASHLANESLQSLGRLNERANKRINGGDGRHG